MPVRHLLTKVVLMGFFGKYGLGILEKSRQTFCFNIYILNYVKSVFSIINPDRQKFMVYRFSRVEGFYFMNVTLSSWRLDHFLMSLWLI